MGVKVTRTDGASLKGLKRVVNGKLQVGWFPEVGKTDSGLPYPVLAYILSYGAKLPGGQPYRFDKKGNLVFLPRRADGKKPKGAFGLTKPSYIPPRPMLERASKKHGKEWQEKARALMRDVIAGQLTPKQALQQLGAVITADIKDAIAHGAYTPNSPLTVKKKGKNTPLIDTGKLRDSVDFKARLGK